MLCYDASSITTHVMRHSLSFMAAPPFWQHWAHFSFMHLQSAPNMFTGSTQQHFPVID
jgi:hypothetical protein